LAKIQEVYFAQVILHQKVGEEEASKAGAVEATQIFRRLS
jgi:hypothetical protein